MNDRSFLAWPYVVGLFLLVATPAAAAFALSFTHYTGITPPEPAGLDNYQRLITSGAFWRALGNSAIYASIAVPLRLVAAVGFALLLHVRGTAFGIGRASVYLPSVAPDVAYALLWLWIFNPFFGPLAAASTALGVPMPDWLTDPWPARVGIAVMSAFQIGEAFVVALAARRLLPQQIYEAAAVEDASPGFVLRKVTLPLMAPVIALLALRDLVFSLQASFVPALIVTDGGPRYATTYLPLLVYRTAFRYFRLGYASALTVTMFVITAFAIYVQYRLAKRWRLI